MFNLNSFKHACVTFSVDVYIAAAQPDSDFLMRRPSLDPTKLHVGFGVHTM
jgi:hypothetical protein